MSKIGRGRNVISFVFRGRGTFGPTLLDRTFLSPDPTARTCPPHSWFGRPIACRLRSPRVLTFRHEARVVSRVVLRREEVAIPSRDTNVEGNVYADCLLHYWYIVGDRCSTFVDSTVGG